MHQRMRTDENASSGHLTAAQTCTCHTAAFLCRCRPLFIVHTNTCSQPANQHPPPQMRSTKWSPTVLKHFCVTPSHRSPFCLQPCRTKSSKWSSPNRCWTPLSVLQFALPYSSLTRVIMHTLYVQCPCAFVGITVVQPIGTHAPSANLNLHPCTSHVPFPSTISICRE